MALHRVIGPDDPNFPAIRRRLIVTWIKTILGYLAMGGLILAALAVFGFTYKFQLGFSLLWILLPVVMWWFSAKIALALTKSVPADPSNPDHKRLIDIVDRVYAKSGLKFKPPVYVSDNPLPNAFATGPIHRKAVVAATRGLFDIGATDAEIEAIFAHELGHVKNYDVGINSGLAVLSSIFFLIVDAGVRLVLGSINLFRKTFGVKPVELGRANQGFVAGILNWVIFYVVFWLTGQLTRIVQLFVVRSRESAADATASQIHGKPCDLATALQKLVAYVEKNRPKGRDESFFRAFRPIMTIDPIYDARAEEPKKGGVWEAIKRFWKRLQLTHPPVPERIAALEKMAGGKCPRI
jgi:heat shock protein HtpX